MFHRSITPNARSIHALQYAVAFALGLGNGSLLQAQEILPKGAEATTMAAQKRALSTLPWEDRADFEDAERGWIAGPPSDAIRTVDGKVVWNFKAYEFENAQAAPDTVHPSLWRQAQLNNRAGLFKVTDRLYQVRGFDISNMNIIEGKSGLIIMDPLITAEAARAALDLYYRHRPRKPVVALIYTHSHTDHFGGAKGVVDEADVRSGKVKVYAPAGFMEEAVSENVIAGIAMSRRAQYMYGMVLPQNARGQVDVGLGKALSRGTVTLVAPTDLIRKPLETHQIDGVEIEFQMTPGTEAPAEMNLYFPQFRALCIAENATHTQHNILTIRGAQVRDAKMWSYYIGDALSQYGDKTDVLFAQHHWPTWGNARIVTYLSDQRDMYAYLHDQTLRLLNHGMIPMDISERVKTLPASLATKWYARDYYGSVSHNVRAIYQRYLGFYDGNPAHLNPLPPVESAKRTIEWMGGAPSVLARAHEAFKQGDYRWVAQIVNEVVFADPTNAEAKHLQADALEQLAYQSENATWRNAYLTGAQELRNGLKPIPGGGSVSPDMVRALTVPLFFDYLGVRLNADKAAGKNFTFNWIFTDLGEQYAMTLRNSALTYRVGEQHTTPDATVSIAKTTLNRISLGQSTVADAVRAGEIRIEGDSQRFTALFAMLDQFDKSFNVVTPQTVK